MKSNIYDVKCHRVPAKRLINILKLTTFLDSLLDFLDLYFSVKYISLDLSLPLFIPFYPNKGLIEEVNKFKFECFVYHLFFYFYTAVVA